MNVVGLKSPAQNHEQTRQVSAVDVASSLFRVPHSEQVNTPSSDLGCASESMLSLEIENSNKGVQNGKGTETYYLPRFPESTVGTVALAA